MRHLREPLAITIEESDGEYIATCEEFGLFGVFAAGTTEQEATAALELEVLDLYDELRAESADRLGKLPLAWLERLNSLVVEREGRP